MTIDQAVKILSDHQKWRLGDDEIEATRPKELTEAINIILKKIEDDKTKNKDNLERIKISSH